MRRTWWNNIYWWTWLLLLLHLCSFPSAHTLIAEELRYDWTHRTKWDYVMASVIICQPWMWGEEIEKKKEKKPEIVNLSSGYSRPFMKCRENYLVFKTCMFFHVCLPASVGGKNNTWDVFDFDTLKTSAWVFVTSDLLPLCRWKWKINWAEDRS